MKIFFIKHGQTPSSPQQTLSRDTEGLSKKGEMEAKRAADDLAVQLGSTRLVSIISSPRRRTLETAHFIADQFGVEIKTDDRLIERDCSPYLGQKISDVFAKSEQELIEGGMESLESVYARTQALWNDITEKYFDGALLLVGHSGNLAPLIYAAQKAKLGDTLLIPSLDLDAALEL